ncbi:LAFA_0G17524g1_1 [Lachancea sp. 'fantastica']|nr:LAFA_0G17524g1_1 [Lachancea sp. 'fantastica']
MKICAFNHRTFCLITCLFASLMEAKNVAHLDIKLDPETGKFKRQLPAGVRILESRDAKNVFPLNVDEVLEKESLKKRENERQQVYAAGEHNEHKDLKSQETWSPVCLDSKLPSYSDISIFSRYLRDDIVLSSMISDPSSYLVVLAPSNDAIERLSKKPWQFPIDVEALEAQTSDEETIERAVRDNIRSFVENHIATIVSNDKAQRIKDLLDDGSGATAVLSSLTCQKGSEKPQMYGDMMLSAQDGKFRLLPTSKIIPGSTIPEAMVELELMDEVENGAVFVIQEALVSA